MSQQASSETWRRVFASLQAAERREGVFGLCFLLVFELGFALAVVLLEFFSFFPS